MESRTCTPRRPRIIAGATMLLEWCDEEIRDAVSLFDHTVQYERTRGGAGCCGYFGGLQNEGCCSAHDGLYYTLSSSVDVLRSGQARLTAYVTALPKTSWRWRLPAADWLAGLGTPLQIANDATHLHNDCDARPLCCPLMGFTGPSPSPCH